MIIRLAKFTPLRNIVSKTFKDLFWESRNGTKVLISDMSDKRLMNTFVSVYKLHSPTINGYKKEVVLECLDYHIRKRNLTNKVDELKKEKTIQKRLLECIETLFFDQMDQK
jgi:hypothetical protein